MKITVKRPFEVNLKKVEVILPVKHGGEVIPYDFPFRIGDIWRATIDIDTGGIDGWPNGRKESMYMKVCDSGSYIVTDENGEIVKRTDDYVPSFIPNEYGDYVDFDINERGVIKRWNETIKNIESFFNEAKDED